MATYLPIRALNRSANVRIDGQKILPTVTAFVDISKASVRKELASHSSIGQVIVVGGITASNSDTVIVSGGIVTAHSSGLKVDVTAGVLKVRSTGATVAGVGENTSGTSLATADGTNPRVDLVVWDTTTGAIGKVDGVAAASPVPPAVPAGKVALAKVAVAASATAPGTITDLRVFA